MSSKRPFVCIPLWASQAGLKALLSEARASVSAWTPGEGQLDAEVRAY